MSEVTLNRLTVKTLLMSVITEIKFGQPLTANANQFKKTFKKLRGLKPRATNESVIAEIGKVYKENNLVDDFKDCMKKLRVEDLIPKDF